MPLRLALARCNSGHYFSGSVCPFDGWSIDGLDEIKLAELRLQDAGRELSLEGLRSAGVSDAIAARVVVIEFPSPDAVFDAVEPQGLIVNGEYVDLGDLGPELR